MTAVPPRRAVIRRIERYAAKFAAETVSSEPPCLVEPTLDNLAVYLASCVRPPHADELPAIREMFIRHYATGAMS